MSGSLQLRSGAARLRPQFSGCPARIMPRHSRRGQARSGDGASAYYTQLTARRLSFRREERLGSEGTGSRWGCRSSRSGRKRSQFPEGRFEISHWERARGGWTSPNRGRARGPGLKRRLPSKRSFYLGCRFMKVGSGRADGDYRETSADRSPLALPWHPAVRAPPKPGYPRTRVDAPTQPLRRAECWRCYQPCLCS